MGVLSKDEPPKIIAFCMLMPISILLDVVANKEFAWSWSIYFWSFLLAICVAFALLMMAVGISIRKDIDRDRKKLLRKYKDD